MFLLSVSLTGISSELISNCSVEKKSQWVENDIHTFIVVVVVVVVVVMFVDIFVFLLMFVLIFVLL